MLPTLDGECPQPPTLTAACPQPALSHLLIAPITADAVEMATDGAEIRAVARMVSGLAGRTRAAGTAVTGAGHARWQSVGAQKFREQLGRREGEFRSCARDLDDLSRLLVSHAAHVEAHEAAVIKAAFAIEKGITDAVDGAVEFAGDVKDAASGTASALGHAGKDIIDTANPLTALRSIR